VKGAERNSHGLARQHKREQGEEMFEIAVRGSSISSSKNQAFSCGPRASSR
jgi:hypothetical protein